MRILQKIQCSFYRESKDLKQENKGVKKNNLDIYIIGKVISIPDLCLLTLNTYT